MKKQKKKQVNWKVIIYSTIALICVVLAYVIDWLFLVPAVVLMLLNQRELFKK